MISISSNLNIMIKAAEKASKSAIRDFGEVEKLQVSKKGPRDFVTKTDKHVEKILIEELSKTKKNYSFLSEEAGSIKIFSTCLSVFVTKSRGPFFDTCSFSTSPKSLIADLEAFSAALIIMFKFEDIEIILDFFNVF